MAKQTAEAETRTQVPAETFVKTYRDSSTLQEVADKLGIKYASVLSRRKSLAEKGVKFKDMPRAASSRIDVAALNAISEAKAEE